MSNNLIPIFGVTGPEGVIIHIEGLGIRSFKRNCGELVRERESIQDIQLFRDISVDSGKHSVI